MFGTKFGCFCMEFMQGARSRPNLHYSLVECRSPSNIEKAKAEEIGEASRGSSEGGSEEAKTGQSH